MTSMLARACAFALLVILSAAGPRARAQSGPELPASGRLGAGDWVSIHIAGQPDSTSYVGTDGTINVPLIGNVPVAGISTTQAAERVAKALKEGGFFVDPQVTMESTQQPQGQSVTVLGQVGTQGPFAVTSRTTIVELLARAGGVKEDAADVGFVLRRDESGKVTQYPVSLRVLADSQGPPSTWEFLAGDSLYVPKADLFIVNGEVKTPGQYRIEPGMTVLQAIARAGGINERGSERRIQVKRTDKPGHIKTSHANPGDLVKPGDIIYVKESLF